ncbi:MAG: hypothetical protein LQ344_001984 [Seirophora lacunosa]|nr:MAG: hypothetical protein LQ344_001984 [Seirophora lacunosa]
MDDWDTVTKIGSKVTGGASQKETVVRGKSALNAAQRSGAIVGTEKKFSAGNPVSYPLPLQSNSNPPPGANPNLNNPPPFQSSKPGVEGQRLTKVDRSDDIVPVQKVSADIGAAIRTRRGQDGYKMTQADLAKKVNVPANDIKTLESGQAVKNQQLLNKVARVLKISPKTGKPLDEEPVKGSSSSSKK